jgi:hypothetical protein
MDYDNSYDLDNKDKPTEKEIQRIQTIHGKSTFILVIPKDFISELGIEKGVLSKPTNRETRSQSKRHKT